MNSNFFLKKNIKLKKLFPKNQFKQDFIIKNIQPLSLAKKNEITFLTLFLIRMKPQKQRHLHVLLPKN